MDSCSQENKGNWIMVKKNKSRDPSLVSLAVSRSRVKVDVGVKPKTLGKKSLSQAIQEEARRNLANGSHRTIKECSSKKNEDHILEYKGAK